MYDIIVCIKDRLTTFAAFQVQINSFISRLFFQENSSRIFTAVPLKQKKNQRYTFVYNSSFRLPKYPV